jgi:Icc-related predicted phosphoesterase
MKYFKVLLKIKRIIALIGIILLFVTCDKVFEYSPYEANVSNEYKNTTVKNLQLIKNIQTTSDTFKFAFITDNHYQYTNLKTVIDDINRKDDIVFVILGGDIAHEGLRKEYMIFYNIMETLHKPYLTAIGNHDYLSNGEVVYQQMFGVNNYSFVFNDNKFVIFDDVVWESDMKPDFIWLSTQLTDNSLFKQVFVIAHIPPFSDQFDSEMEQTYKTLMQENNVQLSIHGHVHSYSFGKYYEDSVDYLTCPNLKNPTYCIINVSNMSSNIELIEL